MVWKALTHSAMAFFCAEEPEALMLPEIPEPAAPLAPVSLVEPESLQPARVRARAAETAALAMRRFFTVVLLSVIVVSGGRL